MKTVKMKEILDRFLILETCTYSKIVTPTVFEA